MFTQETGSGDIVGPKGHLHLHDMAILHIMASYGILVSSRSRIQVLTYTGHHSVASGQDLRAAAEQAEITIYMYALDSIAVCLFFL